jgi:hypothetical protein
VCRDSLVSPPHGIADDDILHSIEGDEVIIHAMPLRPVYRKLFEP